ncbi:hypothetical protein JXA85_00725 [Candidatus Woesearchaeota archaeon]|nr:hypothetical protein [Candidatus Woesearchaeota archaeon]
MKSKDSIAKRIWDLKLLIILAILVVVIMILYVDFSKINPFRKEKYFKLDDVCGVIPGGINLIHTINDEEECDVQCYNKCISSNLKKIKSTFVMMETECNRCNCECR